MLDCMGICRGDTLSPDITPHYSDSVEANASFAHPCHYYNRYTGERGRSPTSSPYIGRSVNAPTSFHTIGRPQVAPTYYPHIQASNNTRPYNSPHIQACSPTHYPHIRAFGKHPYWFPKHRLHYQIKNIAFSKN